MYQVECTVDATVKFICQSHLPDYTHPYTSLNSTNVSLSVTFI